MICCTAVYAGDRDGHNPVTVRAETDRTSVSIGDRIKYSITVEAEREIEVEFPEFGENLADFSIRDFGSSEGGYFGSRTMAEWYILDIYEAGTYTIPGTAVKYRRDKEDPWKEIHTDPVAIEVVSVLGPDTDTAEIRDIKGPVSLFNYTFAYSVLAVVAVIVIIVLTVIFLRKRRKPEMVVELLRPAHEIAYEDLKELMGRDYLKSGKVQEFYFEVSGIIRRYIENRFQLRAPEMTTEEFLVTLKSAEVLNSEQKGSMEAFLLHCDMVKFAKYHPGEKEIDTSYESAKKFIDQTREDRQTSDVEHRTSNIE